jgi:hypothetical protein
MSYCTNDFDESLREVQLEAKPVKVLKAWGRAEEPDVCCHSDWSGGFLMLLENGRYAYLSGWCDYTGWGCQDGAEVVHADAPEKLTLPDENWDDEPADLNKWIADGMVPWDERN